MNLVGGKKQLKSTNEQEIITLKVPTPLIFDNTVQDLIQKCYIF